ncbi:MAG: hypothetical protein N2C14_09845, partial [Planctomycetales bacterium]
PKDAVGSVLDAALFLTRETMKAERYDAAKRVFAVAEQAAAKVASREARDFVAEKKQAFAKMDAAYRAVAPHLRKLADDPVDSAANLKAGEYYCFAVENWLKGLPYLAQGSDPRLKELAELELKRPVDPEAQIEIAQGWEESAKQPGDPRRSQKLRRAAYWYQLARTRADGLLLISATQSMRRLGVHNLSKDEAYWTRRYRDKTVLFVRQKRTWNEAEKWCTDRDAHLVCIANRTELLFAAEYAVWAGAQNEFWIGGTDAGSEGKWRWVDGTAWRFTNWTSGEPNNAKPGEHVAVMGFKKRPLMWNDAVGKLRRFFIAQWKDDLH